MQSTEILPTASYRFKSFKASATRCRIAVGLVKQKFDASLPTVIAREFTYSFVLFSIVSTAHFFFMSESISSLARDSFLKANMFLNGKLAPRMYSFDSTQYCCT
jgi:hypothetical protein